MLLEVLTVGILLLSWSSITQSQCTGSLSEAEFQALEALYVSGSGINWMWNPPPPSKTVWTFPSNRSVPCSHKWQGLDCEVVEKVNGIVCVGCCTVRDIKLTNFNLVGFLPHEIGNLTNLQILDLNTNTLSQRIPTSIGLMTNLNTLSLYFNFFSHDLPTEIGLLTAMQSISIFDCALNGTLPTELGLLTNLVSLVLDSNFFTGRTPTQLGLLVNLKLQLSLFGNSLNGSIGSWVGSLTKLESIDFNNNYLTGQLPTEIGLLTNSLTGHISTYLSLLTNLQELDVDTNLFSEKSPQFLDYSQTFKFFPCFQTIFSAQFQLNWDIYQYYKCCI